jgi:hypothetical protein
MRSPHSSSAASIARERRGVRSGGGWIIPCPVPSHGKGRGDRNPSCSISDGELGLIVFCHAGCDRLDVLRCLGVETSHRRDKSASRQLNADRPQNYCSSEIVSDDGRPQWLWRQRRPIIEGSPPWRYLREARGYSGPIPATLGYLPPRDEYPPSLIAAFGMASEPEPGVLAMADADVKGVHLTRLRADGSAKAGTEKDKIMIGHCMGSPVVLAPANDGLGLAVVEGVEDALSVHQATGLGAWAAGSAGRMAALAETVLAYIDCVTIVGDRDPAGECGATDLASRLKARGFEVLLTLQGASA